MSMPTSSKLMLSNLSKNFHFLITNKKGLTLIGFALVLVIMTVVVLQQKQQVLYQWNGVIPGKTSITDLEKTLGQPIQTKQQGDQTVYGFKSAYPSFPHEVAANSAGTVSFVREWVPTENPKKIADYLKELGQPEFVTKSLDEGYTIYAYPNRGIAFNAHTVTETLFHIWHFPPMTADQFKKEFAQYFEQKELNQEKF